MNNYYKILGVDKKVNEDEIKKAYRKIAKENHPDSNPDDEKAAERFEEASEAYEVLSDKEKRKEYDDEINAKSYYSSDFNFGNIFNSGAYDEIINDMINQVKNKAYKDEEVKKGENIETAITIDFMEAIDGCKKNINISGKTIEVSIPAGFKDKQKLRLTGAGTPGNAGGTPSDLYITVYINSDPYFKRTNNDIYTNNLIPYSMVVLGGILKIRTLTGECEINIPAGTKPGNTIRLKGKGINNGDHFVLLHIDIPAKLNHKQKELIEELKSEGL